ncbi:MAG: single-stranded DNA-binding protein [Coriobacteriia bacterium]|nr:single-stranded DNA-binding protein [Coriobacteriia bacterium]
MSINRVVLTGNLTRDAELKQTSGGMAIVNCRLAVNDRRKNPQSGQWEDRPNYIDVVIFGSRGEALSRFLSKGKQIAVEGKLRWSEWESQAGEKRSKVEVVADDIELLGGRGDAPAGAARSASVPAADLGDAPVDGPDSEDIPF